MNKIDIYNEYKAGNVNLDNLDLIQLLTILESLEYEIDHIIKEIKVKESELIDLKPDDD